MALDPRTFDFWRKEELLLNETLSPIVVRALIAGAAAGADALPAAMQPFVNWDVVNRGALEFLRRYRVDTIPNISETTRKQIIGLMDDWIRSGQHLNVLKAQLAELPALSKTRADMIGITEVTRIFNAGNHEAWKATGIVSSERWNTANDERVCFLCGPLEGKIVSIDSDFPFDAETIANSPQMRVILGDDYTQAAGLNRANAAINNLGAGVLYPPAHPRCRCWTSPVVSEVAITRQFEDILNG